jgi:RHS repeat-associated protein
VYFYQLDQLGTPLSLTDSENTIVWQAHYSVFGKATVTVNKIDNPIRFQGQYFDSESGLHYNHFRYYDPETGRFISQDPIGLLGGINHYQYAPNHINWIDPLGLCAKENTWNEFQKDHKGVFANSSAAAEAYRELIEKQSPWPYGFDYKSHIREMKIGEAFNMIVDEGKEDMPGRFATFDNIPDAEYGRQKLAIKESWKPTLDNVVTYEVNKPFEVYEGPVGPQIDNGKYLKGGGTQITFVDNSDWASARPNKYNDYTDNPVLQVKSIRALDDEN